MSLMVQREEQPFDKRLHAINWMLSEVQLWGATDVSMIRFAFEHCDQDMSLYASLRHAHLDESAFDIVVIVDGKRAWVGCNYIL